MCVSIDQTIQKTRNPPFLISLYPCHFYFQTVDSGVYKRDKSNQTKNLNPLALASPGTPATAPITLSPRSNLLFRRTRMKRSTVADRIAITDVAQLTDIAITINHHPLVSVVNQPNQLKTPPKSAFGEGEGGSRTEGRRFEAEELRMEDGIPYLGPALSGYI